MKQIPLVMGFDHSMPPLGWITLSDEMIRDVELHRKRIDGLNAITRQEHDKPETAELLAFNIRLLNSVGIGFIDENGVRPEERKRKCSTRCQRASSDVKKCKCSCHGATHGCQTSIPRGAGAVNLANHQPLKATASPMTIPPDATSADYILGDSLTRKVLIAGHLLRPERSLSFRNHSPDGFSWGYGGSGPAQLALAILLEIGDAGYACDHYQEFKREIIAGLPMESDFALPIARVRAWIEAHP